MPNPSIKDEKLYEELRDEGNSKEKSARISNAAAARGRSSVGRAGGKSGSYDDWTVDDLRGRAKELGIIIRPSGAHQPQVVDSVSGRGGAGGRSTRRRHGGGGRLRRASHGRGHLLRGFGCRCVVP